MDRRELLLGCGAALSATNAMADGGRAPPLPGRDRIEVAFVVGPNANLMDVAGPWEVFQDVMWTEAGKMTMPFRLSLVATSMERVALSGGLTVQPRHAFADAPQPNVIVVPAQRPTPATLDWIKRNAVAADLTMSVCTGAFVLGMCGLLDGLSATTHHDFWDRFATSFPRVRLQRGGRFVDNGRVATSGGLTSGVDLALHVVERYFGSARATSTARYLEYTPTNFTA